MATAEELRIVEANKWASVTFTGARVRVGGILLDDSTELSMPGALVADICPDAATNSTEFLLVDERGSKALTPDELSARLLKALRALAHQQGDKP